MKKNIFLIGYRCTGKTTLGAALADCLGWTFVDVDDVLVAEAGMSIAQMVENHGWPWFRAREKALMKRLAVGDRQVVGTGGGVILEQGNVDAMRAGGTVVWLRSRPETIRRYIGEDSRSKDLRPALTAKGLLAEIEETLAAREPLYRAAMDIAVDTDAFDVNRLCKVIMQALQQYGFNG